MSIRGARSGVLVTGATTPTGRALVARLLADEGVGHVLAIGAEPPDRSGLATGVPDLTYRQVDLTRTRDIRTLLFGLARDLAIGTIVQSALHRRASDHGDRRVHAQNVESTRALLHLAERHPTIRRFVLRSAAEVYRIRSDQPTVISEDHPVELSPDASAWVRDRVEADLMVCSRMGLAPLAILVLRCAEVVGPGCGSQILDFLSASVCLRPLGFDPVLNLLSVDDAARALHLAVSCPAEGIFNVPGRDTLPLSEAIRRWGKVDLPVPGPLLHPLYRLRRALRHADFRYDVNRARFHFGGILDGRRARDVMGYTPERGIEWPGA